MTNLPDYVDITPTPRVLRVLGDIPFEIWQCFAELLDNSLDSFKSLGQGGETCDDPIASITWSSEAIAENDKQVEIADNGPGMTLEQVQRAVKAGYTSNDPLHNLGLFGMGFNIATARLGEKTRILSATKESSDWIGIEIDFSTLIKSGEFSAPIIRESKDKPEDHGTRIVVRSLRPGVSAKLVSQRRLIKEQLERVYSPLLEEKTISIQLQGNALSARPHCCWGSSRYVMLNGQKIPAIIDLDRDLGECYFDQFKNRYLTEAECDEYEQQSEESRPSSVVKRQKRLRGWVGIQRYGDPNDFGIDFIRNGRKILLGDKTAFSYRNPLTNDLILEYPKELGSTWGGRIVGELHVDYLIPTYQKEDFDRNDPSWDQTIKALREGGPIQQKVRRALEFPGDNDSPIGKLVRAYARQDAGTKNLSAPRETSLVLLKEFRAGKADFLSDEKWWKACQEEDQRKANREAPSTPTNSGDGSSDDASAYGPTPENDSESTVASPEPSRPKATTPTSRTTSLDELLQSATKIESLSGKYRYGETAPYAVRAYELNCGDILKNGDRLPCVFFDEGPEIDFVFNRRHPFLAEFPIEPEHLLATRLAEKFNVRDNIPDTLSTVERIMSECMGGLRIDKMTLQARAEAIFNLVREGIFTGLQERKKDVLETIHQSSGDVEATISQLLESNPELVMPFQNKEEAGFDAVYHVSEKVLLRIVEEFPEQLFDGKLFIFPYLELSNQDKNAEERLRKDAKSKIVSYLLDALWLCNLKSRSKKAEMQRASHSVNFLEDLIERT